MNRTVIRWGLGFLIWTVLALLSASQRATYFLLDGRPVEWGMLIASSMISWYSCAIFTPLFFVAARRWPVDSRRWLVHLPLHLALCGVATVIKFAIERELMVALLDLSMRPLGFIVVNGFISENIAFWCMAAAVHAIEFQRRAREREVQSARLQARLSQAQLETLATRLHPHFLFNTLQAVSTLVHRDPGAADAMLGHLSTLLRRMLQSEPKHEVTLADELALLEEYLAIAETRFGERLTIVREIAPETAAALVPYLVLQPLVENALEHGIARKAGTGVVAIRAARHGDTLRVTITDDGRGQPEGPTREGVGLGTTRARLVELYGADAALTVEPGRSVGTVATLIVPWHTAPALAVGERVA